MADKTLPVIRTLHEAAEYMKLTPNALARAARKIGACSEFGRDIFLSEDDIQAVWEANRCDRRVTDAHSVYSLSSYQVEKRLKELTAKKNRKPTR